MVKAKLEFDWDNTELDDERLFDAMRQGPQALAALREIGNEIFRPARKHGYNTKALKALTDEQAEMIGVLEKMFYDILRNNNIILWD